MIVYCYPAALTPGCTTQAVDFTAAAGDLAQAGLDIIGISPDEPEKLLRFREKEKLGITLVSDPDKTVLKAYGAYGPKKLYGKEVVGVIRSTFIVDAEGRIEKRRLQRQGDRPRGQAAPRPGPRLTSGQWWASLGPHRARAPRRSARTSKTIERRRARPRAPPARPAPASDRAQRRRRAAGRRRTARGRLIEPTLRSRKQMWASR